MTSLGDRNIATGIVDLTFDSESEDETPPPAIQMASSALQPKVPHPTSITPMSARTPATTTSSPCNSYVPLPSNVSRAPPMRNITREVGRSSAYGATPPTSSSRPPSTASAGGPRQTYVPLPTNTYNGANDALGPSGKRRKLSMQAKQTPVPLPKSSAGASRSSMLDNELSHSNGMSAYRGGSGHAGYAQAGPTPSRLSNISSSSTMSNKVPSVQYMNTALKSSGTTSPLIAKVDSNGPRPLQIGRMPGSSGFDLPSPSLATPSTPTIASPSSRSETNSVQSSTSLHSRQGPETTALSNGQIRARAARTGRHMLQQMPNKSHFASALPIPSHDDRDSVMSDVSLSISHAKQSAAAEDNISVHRPSPLPTTKTAAMKSAKAPSQFTEEEEHLLIFLKEVKKFSWKLITSEFNKDFPGRRPYHTLQSRYSTKTNRRDRSQDPATLNLPLRWAAEAVIDWDAVHADSSGPRDPVEVSNLNHDVQVFAAPIHSIPHRTVEPDYSSGTDSGLRQKRTRRAPPVNYDVRKRIRQLQADESDAGDDNHGTNSPGIASPFRSESPSQAQAAIPAKALVVKNEPLEMHFAADDAGIGLLSRTKSHNPPSQRLPYLSHALRVSLQGPPEDWDWEQISSRDWQGAVLHVDFGPDELEHVQNAMFRLSNSSRGCRHSTQRRHLRSLLKDMSDPMLLRLCELVQRKLPSRDSRSIVAFLADARAGTVAESPRILRLCSARPKKSASSMHAASTSSMLRLREIGSRSRRGWQTATTPLAYQTRNQVMDTLGPSSSWTGASSDVHTVAWSQDGECYAAGAVAVTDRDSMQYNRPNNLLFGNVSDASIHELAEHRIERERMDSGANSSHAMFVSQDRELYTTVTSVAFARSGRLMYSAGYDESLCVWELGSTPSRPRLAAKLKHKGKVEMVDVNAHNEGCLATAARRAAGASIKIVKLDEEDPSQFQKYNFNSEKASSRADLNILPQALRFEPRYGGLLLAGFGANVREDNGFDLTGDLCLWDIETQSQIPIYGSNRNVFDVAFNPNQRYMPLFAAGCVANGNVNRGTRSVIRLYEPGMDKYTCPLEIECKALDMNDVVWCPQDEHLIAAGCTDGRVYVWDMRRPDEPLVTLSHGHSLMPLQEGVHHERTDTGIRFLSWGDNATRLYSGSSDGVVKVWDVTRSVEDTFIKDLVTLDSGIMAGAFSPDYSKLALGEVNGSVNVLDVGRDDCAMKDAEKLRYVPYAGHANDEDSTPGSSDAPMAAESGFAEGALLLQTQQLQVTSMGSLPIRQVVQGAAYQGPYDQSVDAPFLREQALEFQLSMARPSGPQCNIAACKDNIVTVTSEEIGDSGRSSDRIPDALRLQWIAAGHGAQIMPGKSRCTHCGRAARPSTSDDADAPVLCERCSFGCFRCGATNPITSATTTLVCDTCTGVWEIGALGYECIQQPTGTGAKLDVPSLRRYGRDGLVERFEDKETTFGDEINALTDYYHSLAIDRPESPPL